MLRHSAEAGSTSVLAAALAIMVFIDVPINYMANRWFRTNHPQPVTLDDPRMKFALMTTMVAFLAFAALIVWFRYYVERIAQKIAVTHVQKMGVLASVVLPAALFLQLPAELDLHRQRVFMYSGYIVAWVIYIGYLLPLMAKLGRLKREAAELAAESPSLH
jgi:cation transport ATPase